jgi:hypothetical protein
MIKERITQMKTYVICDGDNRMIYKIEAKAPGRAYLTFTCDPGRTPRYSTRQAAFQAINTLAQLGIDAAECLTVVKV